LPNAPPLTPAQEEDEVHKSDHYVQVSNRGLLQLEGADTVRFLQGLITNHMPLIERGGDGFYAATLTPQAL
jgi:folate-binding Fe-S cluster repair protein YgfZ